ncbi:MULTISPECIES: amidohydrolase family protein [unclassified Streptomyces]|uniref:amidohydrolase family protein n=1 Tax=unclassified Streptomyces TaxID=2593676 RepID=UPI002E8108EE|nr:amidohydrolase family protein [Streptomyces sp. NBC_00589]WTI33876.1 amidohydrolase family protein [Streptomyces sp. NBC_00775]WUB32451.1 amidohydrolase family protein [Streptomyces sp. NBC_00589]
MTNEVSGAPTPHAPPPKGAVAVYRGATLFDGTGRPPRPSTSILIDGPTIRAVADDAVIAEDLPADAQVFDLDGRFVMPGLIDSHQHIATPPDRPSAEAVLRRLVYSGVTAIRDMADDLRQVGDLARATLVGEIPGPDIRYAALMAGPGFFDDPRTHQVSQGETPGAVPWMQAITDDTDLRLAVALARGTHACAIKVYADLDHTAVAAIAAEAHQQGIPVWAHATVFPATPRQVVMAGADSVSHVTLLAFEGAEGQLTSYEDKPQVDHQRFATGDDPRLEELFALMRQRGTVLDATAGMWASDALAGDGPQDAARAAANTELAARITAQAYRAGVDISTGTDYETDPKDPFPALYEELAFLVRRCGIPPERVLRSATLIGARSAGAEDVMGSVEAGKLANFVVLDDDPLRDIGHLRSVTLTVKRGRRFERGEFVPGDSHAEETGRDEETR